MFSDFVLATQDDIKKLAKSDNPADEFNGFAVRSLSDWDVAIFYALASGATSISDLAFEIESVHHTRKIDIRKIPDSLVKLVSGMDDQAADAVSSAWESNEDSFCRWDKADYFAFVKDFRDLSARALSAKKGVYMVIAGG